MTTPIVRLATVITLTLVTLWVHLAELGADLQWDSHIFMTIAKQMRYGLLPYRDLWELKPPAMFYYLRAIFIVLPEALWSVRFVDFAVYTGAGLVFYRLCRREVSRLLALAGTGAWLFVAHHTKFNMGGLYTEEYAAINGIIAVACAAAYAKSGRARWALASGSAIAAAALFKHPGAAALIPSAVLITQRPALRAYALLLCGFVTPLVLVMAYFWSQGALTEFLECNVWAVIVHGRMHKGVDQAFVITRLRELVAATATELNGFPFLFAALGVATPFVLLAPSWLRVAALLWVVLDFLGVAAQRQFANHHFILTFPSTCLIGTLAAGWLLEPRSRDRWFVTLARAGLCIAALWVALPAVRTAWQQRLPVVLKQWSVLRAGPTAWPQSPARTRREEAVGHYVRDRTAPDARVHVQGFAPSLLGIYWATDRRVATRYFYEPPYPLDQSLVIAELRQNRPAYVVLGTHPTFHPIMPWLMSDYVYETGKWHEYRNDIWVRSERAGFSAGAMAGLVEAADLGGLVLPRASSAGTGVAAGQPIQRQGLWTSPVVPAHSEDGRVLVDWSPRADLVWNRTGRAFPQVSATLEGIDNDVGALLGRPTKRGYWTVWPNRDPQAVTVHFGLPVLLDQVEMIPNDLRYGNPAGCAQPVVQSISTGASPEYQLLEGAWEKSIPFGVRTLRPTLPVLSAGLRVIVTPQSCGGEGGIRRIRARPAGMGVTARYRSGAEPALDAQPWRPLEDKDDELWVTTERYVQVQYELWSTHPDLSPILRMAQVGRQRFELDAPVAMTRD